MEGYCRGGQATDDSYNTAHEHCLLGTKGCKYTLRICDTYCFPTNAPRCYVIRTLPVLSILTVRRHLSSSCVDLFGVSFEDRIYAELHVKFQYLPRSKRSTSVKKK